MKPDSCALCPGLQWQGFVPEEVGTDYHEGGVLLVGEAPGEDEARIGRPFVGRSGQWVTQTLQRWQMPRSQFAIANVIRSRPPDNKLRGRPDEHEVILHCAHFLDETIARLKPGAIVAMGDVALQRLIGLTGIKAARGYVHQTRYGWVVPTYHPAFILRGNFRYTPAWIYDIGRAVEVAREGFSYHEPRMLLDPRVGEFEGWVQQYESRSRQDPSTPLIFDIETPTKGEDEEESDLDDPSYTILRIGFSYGPNDWETASLPWVPELLPQVHRLFSSRGAKIAHNTGYDSPRIRAANIQILGEVHDTMVAWHVLHSDLDKGLGSIAPFYAPRVPMWKHLSSQEPARYNGLDCYVTERAWDGILKGLARHRMLEVYQSDVVEIDPIHADMSRRGMPVDQARRIKTSKLLTKLMERADAALQSCVPKELFPLQPKLGYTRAPKDTAGMEERVFLAPGLVCQACGQVVTAAKAHTKVTKKTINPCAGATVSKLVVEQRRWVRVLPFVPSPKGLLEYMAHRGHPIQMDKKKDGSRKPTTNEKALNILMRKFPSDPVYPATLRRREIEKLGGTYIGWWDEEKQEIVGGMPIGADGLMHTTFSYDASTLRFTSSGPNLQNIPRAS